MNSFSPVHRPSDEDKKAALADFIKAIKESENGRAEYAKQAPEAMLRLAHAVYGHDNSQALTVAACLASIYNGSEAQPVRLDDIRHLDWSLLKDLLAVLVGTGQQGFEDVQIRKAFEQIGGKAAVDWFHEYTDGYLYRAALKRLVAFIVGNPSASSAKALKGMFASLVGQGSADLSRLNYIDDQHTKDIIFVLDGLFGRGQGSLHLEEISEACEKAGLTF